MCALLQPRPVSAASPPYLSWIQGGKKLKQNRAKSRIAWNNVVPANVHEEDWPPSIVMGAWLQSTLHTGPAPCLYQYLSSACAHRHTVLSTVPRRTDARVSPETVNFIANRYLWIVEPPRFIQHWWQFSLKSAWYFEFHFPPFLRILFLVVEIRINWLTCCCWDS